MHKNCTGHSAQIARGKLCGRCPLKPANLPWYNKVKSKITLESLFLQPFHTRERGNTMSRFQAGALVVYGNLGVHEVEGIGLQNFCDESAREYYTLRPYFSDHHDRSYISATKRPLPFKNGGGLLRPADLPLVKRIGKRLNCSIIVYFKIQSYTFWCVYKSEHLCRNQQRRKVCHVKPS